MNKETNTYPGDILITKNIASDSYIKTINHITTDGINYVIEDKVSRKEIDKLKSKLDELMAKPKFVKFNCMNCGAPITNRIDDHILKCKYCKTAYFVGTDLINMIN